jgi:hypothetical protein
MENSPSREVVSFSTTQEVLRVLLEFEGLLPCLEEPATYSYFGPNQSITTPYHSFRSILILSSHILLGFVIRRSINFVHRQKVV